MTELTKCSIPGCGQRAAFEVIFYSVDPMDQYVVTLRDESWPYLCLHHKEAELRGTDANPSVLRARNPGLLKAYCEIHAS